MGPTLPFSFLIYLFEFYFRKQENSKNITLSIIPVQNTYVSAKEKCMKWLFDYNEHFSAAWYNLCLLVGINRYKFSYLLYNHKKGSFAKIDLFRPMDRQFLWIYGRLASDVINYFFLTCGIFSGEICRRPNKKHCLKSLKTIYCFLLKFWFFLFNCVVLSRAVILTDGWTTTLFLQNAKFNFPLLMAEQVVHCRCSMEIYISDIKW